MPAPDNMVTKTWLSMVTCLGESSAILCCRLYSQLREEVLLSLNELESLWLVVFSDFQSPWMLISLFGCWSQRKFTIVMCKSWRPLGVGIICDSQKCLQLSLAFLCLQALLATTAKANLCIEYSIACSKVEVARKQTLKQLNSLVIP